MMKVMLNVDDDMMMGIKLDVEEELDDESLIWDDTPRMRWEQRQENESGTERLENLFCLAWEKYYFSSSIPLLNPKC